MASASHGQGAKRKRDESDEDAGQSLTASASGQASRVLVCSKNLLRRELRNADVGVDLEESFWKLLLLEVDQTLLLYPYVDPTPRVRSLLFDFPKSS